MKRASWLLRLLALLLVFGMVAAACGDDDDDDTTSAADDGGDAADGGAGGDDGSGADGDTLRVAMLLPGVRNDNSFSQAGYEGLVAAAEADGNIEYEILEEIIEPTDSLPALRNFAEEGYDLIIGHGIEYVDPIQELYTEYPDVNFVMSGGVLVEGAVMADNVNDWLYNVQDMAYPNGIVAGNALTGDTIGIVGGPEFDFVKSMHASFREAALSVNPDIEFLEGFAGSFVDVQAAAEVAQSLIDQGADYIYCSGDGICIGAAQTAAAAGIPISTGFGSQIDAAPDVFLTASVMKLDELYVEWFDAVRSGSFGNTFYPSGIANGQIVMTDVNQGATVETAVGLEELQTILDDFVASVQSGEFEIPFPG
ncbi:MAG: BMP family protein [Acidimicrobiales bacterium]|nr:BMP family protein [Acidimicrobiales bacterium]